MQSTKSKSKEIRTSNTSGFLLDHVLRKSQRKKYRFVIDFDSTGFWQLRRSIHTFPTPVLREVLGRIQEVLANRP